MNKILIALSLALSMASAQDAPSSHDIGQSSPQHDMRNYAFSRLELVDKDELFPRATVVRTDRIGAYTFDGVRDVICNRTWQMGLGGDLTFYSKPAALNAV